MSLPNLMDFPRVAIFCGLMPNRAPLEIQWAAVKQGNPVAFTNKGGKAGTAQFRVSGAEAIVLAKVRERQSAGAGAGQAPAP